MNGKEILYISIEIICEKVYIKAGVVFNLL